MDEFGSPVFSDEFVVEISNKIEPCTTNIIGGDLITNSSNGFNDSACIGGTYNNYNALLTCGQFNEGYPNFNINGNHLTELMC